jgi:hypothetical protein
MNNILNYSIIGSTYRNLTSKNASCAPFFARRNLKFLRDDGTKRTTKIENRLWQVLPTQISSSIQSSTLFTFALSFIITYSSLVQKEIWYISLIIQDMGSSRQTAVKAFLAVCDGTIMLDPWIPDEDWVRQIQESGKDDRCSITNLKTGLAKWCTWQNNHAILHGRTVFCNKKYVRTSKTKANITKPIPFYYVKGAGKPAPTVPSGQGFYQPL